MPLAGVGGVPGQLGLDLREPGEAPADQPVQQCPPQFGVDRQPLEHRRSVE
jgi:hypothetical protein